MTCTCGAAPSQLQATCNTLFSIQGNMAATTGDKVPMVNIKPFGTCSLKPSISGFLPCMPAPTAWTGFVASVQMPGGNPLLQTSTIQCATGGCISFQNSGQMKPNKVVTMPNSPQIDALKRAAKEAAPFCEDSEKKKAGINPDSHQEEFRGKKTEIKPKILRIYFMDERGEPRELEELDEGREVTLCVAVEDGGEGDKIDVEITDTQGRQFKDGKTSMKFTDLVVEADNTAYVDNFAYEFKKD
jgi:hypothetical protein